MQEHEDIYGITIDEQRGVIITTDVNKDEPVIEFCMK